MRKMLFACVAALCLTAIPGKGQDIPDNPVLKEYLRQRGMSDAEAKAMAKSYADRKATEQNRADMAVSPAAETLSIKSENDSSRGIYEDLISDRVVNPDSALKTLKIYGHDLFQNAKANTFSSSNLATPAEYITGSGDEIVVQLWGRLNEEFRLKVDREGKINLPHAGPITVAGMSFNVLQKTILDRMQAIEGVQASVAMGELRSIGVYIVGEVKSPGLYTVNSLSNVTNALFAAGGPTKLGSLRAVQLKRGGAVVATIDFYDFMQSGRDNTALQLKSGDVIMVPVVKRMAAIAGNVRKSALYEIKPECTLKELIALAGGVTPAAWTSRIQVERFQEAQYQVVMDLVSEKVQSVPDFKVQDGDIVKIFAVVERDKNAVYLTGNVFRPGKYEFKEGMKVTDLVADYKAVLPESYLEYAIIMRREPPNYRDRIIPFSLKNAIDQQSSPDNLALMARDEIIVYPRDYFEPDRVVYIDGAVNAPGQVKLFDNMKIRDLIVKAGGLADEASQERGELYRRSYENEKVSVERLEFCVSCALGDDPQANILLRRYDRVYIRKKPGWEEERKVKLSGEFIFPGEYVLLKNETLDQLITRAGGFSHNAYLPAAILTRQSVKVLEESRTRDYVNQMDADAVKLSTQMTAHGQQPAEAQALLMQQQLLISKLKELQSTGRVVIDISEPAAYKGFNLENGDELFVPRELGTVSVLGEVYNQATFRYTGGGLSARRYVELAGGMKSSADQRHVYIIRVSGGIVTNRGGSAMNTALQPGDVVVVPPVIEYKNDFKTFIESVDATFKIVAVISSIVLLIISVKSLQ